MMLHIQSHNSHQGRLLLEVKKVPKVWKELFATIAYAASMNPINMKISDIIKTTFTRIEFYFLF